MKLEKIKTKAELLRRYQHNYRTVFVPNADATLTKNNEELISLQGKNFVDAYNKKIKSLEYYNRHKPRKNATLGLEVLLTFSREDFGQFNIDDWKKENIEWLKNTFNKEAEKYGENVISAVYHADETGNVHIHAMVIPIDDKGKLNAQLC